jgi:selenocysteine-specific elongation factor
MKSSRPPGLLRADVNPDVVMMMCTAGHVDHGKTRLVKLLTGCETDRLKVEKERGMTIELGFAPCFLGGNLCVGIVDVPGHEKFIKNMVAGVSGIGMTVLVIAADDGIMPQTIEHYQIMDLLGVRQGVIALTKIDLVEEVRVRQVTDDIRTFFAGTFLDGAPICPVSSETGAGFFEFYEILVERIRSIVTRRTRGIFRMPIERAFARKGFGVVVTGIPVDGVVKVGDSVALTPGDETGRVRSIQRFLRDADEGATGQCLALNIPDLSRTPPERGQVISLPGYVKAATCFQVRVRTVPGLEMPLHNAEPIKFHTGTSEEPGRVYLLDQTELAQNQTGLATVVVSRPIGAVLHDRFILRRLSPTITVAGGDIVGVVSGKERPRRKDGLDQATKYVEFFRGVDLASAEGELKRVLYFLTLDGRMGASVRAISRGTLLEETAVRETVKRLVEAEHVRVLADDYFVHRDACQACLHEIETRIRAACAQTRSLSMGLGELRKGLQWPAPLWDWIQRELESRGLASFRGDKILLQAAVEGLDAPDRQLMERILELYERTGFQSPRPDEAPELLGAQPLAVNRLLEHLCNKQQLIRVSKNVVFSRNALRKAQDIVVQAIQEKGKLDSADFKYMIDSTRKYALAILDYLDARHVTVRIENDRKLSPDYPKRLLQ